MPNEEQRTGSRAETDDGFRVGNRTQGKGETWPSMTD